MCALCQDAGDVRKRRAEAIAALPAAVQADVRSGRPGRVCAAQATVYDRPGARFAGALNQGDGVRILLRRGAFTRVFAEGAMMNVGWVSTSRLC